MRRLTLLTNPDVCNLHCPLCFLKQRGMAVGLGEMPIEVARRAIEKYSDVRELIPSTMGGPVLYSFFNEFRQDEAILNKTFIRFITHRTPPNQQTQRSLLYIHYIKPYSMRRLLPSMHHNDRKCM